MKRSALILVSVVLLHTKLAFGADSVTVGTLTLTPTFECIGVALTYTNDDNGDMTATIEYKAAASGTWLSAYVPIVDRRGTIGGASNAANQYQVRGSIVGLTANTSYDVRVTLSDAQGVTGTNPATGTVSTLTYTPPTGGTTYYVDTTGSNGNPGSSGSPWATIAYAVGQIGNGDTIKVRAGTYAAFTISSSGTSGAYKVIEPDGAVTVTISNSSNDSVIVSANYWRIRGLNFVAPVESAFRVSASAHHIYIEQCNTDNVSASNVWGSGAVSIRTGANNIYILNNTFTRTSTGTDNVDGIFIVNTGTYQVVIADNVISGPFWDGIGNGVNSELDVCANSDFARNTITDAQDDPIEADGGNVNLRVWGNGVSGSSNSAMSENTRVGPSFIFRNTLKNTKSGGSGIKQGNGGVGYCRFFHNVVRTTGGGGNEGLGEAAGSPQSEQRTVRNSIFYVTGNAYDNQGRTGSTYDYNVLYAPGYTLINNWFGFGGSWETIAELRSNTGQETNGINADPVFVNASTDFHLQTSSPAKNAGVSLANFNDANSGWPLSGAAPDIGAFEFDEGAPPPPASYGGRPRVKIRS